MSVERGSTLVGILDSKNDELYEEWVRLQLGAQAHRGRLIDERELRDQSQRFLAAFRTASAESDNGDIEGRAWDSVRELLEELSVTRARQGFSPSETASFVFSLKQP